MATYNGELYIKEQLLSILGQIKSTDEIIISDDGSTDKTTDIINEINDSRISLIFNNSAKKGYTPNFQNALKAASGDIIFLSDQDDVWLENKYKDVVKNLEIYDLVVTNSIVTDASLNTINESFFSIYSSGTGIPKNIFCCTYYGCCMAFKRNVLQSSMPFPKNDEVAIDLWLGLVAEVIGKVKFLEKPYLLYRRTDHNVTQLGSILSRSKRPIFMKIYKRIVLLNTISKFYIRYKLK